MTDRLGEYAVETGTQTLMGAVGGAAAAGAAIGAFGGPIGIFTVPVGAIIGGLVGLGSSIAASMFEEGAMNDEMEQRKKDDAANLEILKKEDAINDKVNRQSMDLNRAQTKFGQMKSEREIGYQQEDFKETEL